MNILLGLHLAGAFITVIAVVGSVAQILTGGGAYRRYFNSLLACCVLQVGTGVGLVVVAGAANLAAYCVSGVVYIAVVGTLLHVLKRKMAVSLR